MTAFAPRPTYRAWNTGEQMGRAFDQPWSLDRNFSEQFQQGILDSFGLGTAIRELSSGPSPAIAKNLPDEMTLSKEEYQASPSFREAIPWEEGMTETRASALAEFWDKKAVRSFFAEKRPISAFFGQLAGQIFDPINYVPIFGPTVRTAMAARVGAIRSMALIGAGEAAINTAAFGILTADIRSKFGDDVSWQAIGMEIATSALIGGAFGTGIGFIGKGIETRALKRGKENLAKLREGRRVLAEQNSARTTMESLIPLNEAIDAISNGREIDLTPNGIAPAERVRQEADDISLEEFERRTDDIMDRRAEIRAELKPLTEVLNERSQRGESTRGTPDHDRAMALQDEMERLIKERSAVSDQFTAADRRRNGAGNVVINADGERVSVRPEVVELSSLRQASGELQVRNRGSAASAAQIEDIALKLDPAQLMPAVNADAGAPLVGPDNVIDSGNGRTMAIARAAEAYPERYAAYRQAIEAAGYSTEGMTTPVLISRRTTDLTPEARARFNAKSQGNTLKMTAVEIAAMDRDAIMQPGVLDILSDGPVTSAANRPFVNRFLDELPQNERGGLVDEGGKGLNADGVRRIENALIAAAYGDIDPTVIRRFAEATDDNTRAIVGGMADVAGKWALMRRAVRSGEVPPEFDVTPELTQALRLIGRWREEAARDGLKISVTVRENMSQIDMLSGEIAPEVKFLIRSFYRNDHFAVAAGRDTIASQLGKIADAAFELGRPQLFGDATAVSKGEMLQGALALETDYLPATGSLAGAETLRAGDGQPSGAADSGGRRQGSQAGPAARPAPVDAGQLAFLPIAAKAAPEPVPEGLADAQSRVGKIEDMRALAEQHGVKLTDGSFAEQFDIEQMRTEGRLTPEDEASIKAAEDEFAAAEAYGNSLKAAAACII